MRPFMSAKQFCSVRRQPYQLQLLDYSVTENQYHSSTWYQVFPMQSGKVGYAISYRKDF
jgi:hypothetical protein